jgi:UDPglucose 6-dehydrogenase
MTEAKEMLPGAVFCGDAYETMEGADALAIVTEWNEFRLLDLERAKGLLSAPLMIDLRNIYKPDEIVKAGFDYYSVGREPVLAAARV